MKTIEYKVVYAGTVVRGDNVEGERSEEIIRVKARTINSGFFKALGVAHKPLGNGRRKQLHSVEFWQVV